MSEKSNPALRSRIGNLVLRGAPFDVIKNLVSSDMAGDFDRANVETELDKYSAMLFKREKQRRIAAEKTLWMMGVYRQLAEQRRRFFANCSVDEVDTYDFFDPELFFEKYYFANRPVKYRAFAKQWQSFESWSVPNLAARFSNSVVEVMNHRESVKRFDEEAARTQTEMKFADFVTLLENARGRDTNDFYMVARNMNLRKNFGELVDELLPLSEVFSAHRADYLNLWIGPAGTLTKLHHDLTNVFFLQLFGAKRMWFVPPFETELVYNLSGVIAEADVEKPDYQRFPLLAGATVTSTVLDEGDALFIPVGWWHQVRSLSQSVSLTFINFRVENLFSLSEHSHWHTALRGG